MTYNLKACPKCNKHAIEWDRECGCLVCSDCGYHMNRVRCFCGWSLAKGDGRQELISLDEVIKDLDNDLTEGRY